MVFVQEEAKIQILMRPVEGDYLVILASNWDLVKTHLLLTNSKYIYILNTARKFEKLSDQGAWILFSVL